MTYRVVQMCLRGLTFVLMIVALYLNTESDDLTASDSFIMGGVYGALSLVTLGLLLETGLRKHSGNFIECIYLVTATILSLLCAILAFMQFYANGKYKSEAMNKGLISLLAGVVYLIDIVVLFW